MLWTALKARRRRLRRNAAAFLAFMTVFLVLAILIHPAWLSLGAVVGAVAMLSMYRRSQGTAIVLWLRRFGASDAERSVVHVHLGGCCAGMAVPVTIQDSSLQYSYQEASLRSLRGMPLALGQIVALNLLLALLLVPFIDDISSFRYFWVAMILEALLVALLHRRLFRRSGAFALMEPEAVGRFLREIKTGKPRTAGGGGIAVIKVEDAKWPAAIEVALRHTDVLVADVSRLSPNITWELARARERLDARQFVFAYGVDPGEAESVPDDVTNALVSVLGEDTVAGCSWFLYTKRRARRQFLQWRENKLRTLTLMALIAFVLCRSDSAATLTDIQEDLNGEVVFNQLLMVAVLGFFGLTLWFVFVTLRLFAAR